MGSHSIYIQGGSELSKYSITTNLQSALVHLRSPERPRSLWVDAVCIDQLSAEEKEVQVARMGKVYRLATRVIAWLGPEKDDSTRAINTLIWIGNQVQADFSLWLVKPSEGHIIHPSFRDADAPVPLEAEDTRAIYWLLSRTWFERLWVRQEVLLSESGVVQCGLYQAPWATFRRALLCVYMKPRPATPFEDQLSQRFLQLRGFIGQPQRVELGFIRQIFGQSRCKDPRDRVYAILQFLNTRDAYIVGSPDYKRDSVSVFRDITWRWITRHNSLNILSGCEQISPRDTTHASTWVPDWSQKETIFGRTYWRHFSSSQIAPVCSLSSDGRILTTLGFQSATITSLEAIPAMTSRWANEVQWAIRRLLPTSGLYDKYLTGVSNLEAYTRTFLSNAVAENREPWTGLEPTLDAAMGAILELTEQDSHAQAAVRTFDQSTGMLKIIRAMLGGKQIFHGSDGSIGIAPRFAQINDSICVLLGCNAPMVLRQSGEGAIFRIVGDSYVLGLSEGEALLGPYPDHVRRVYVQSDKHGVYSHFENIKTGAISAEDPRLSSLGVDLEEFRRRLREDPGAKLYCRQHDLQVKCSKKIESFCIR